MTKLDTKMIVHARIFFLITALSITAGQTLPRQSKETTIQITEPSVGTLADLFKQADIVALVETVDGNTESYSTAVYKAKVTQSFKGPPSGSTIYFGPHIGMRLGWEYVVFLRTVKEPIAPTTKSASSYGTVPYAAVLREGYGAMMASYECSFDGNDIREKCDYGVRVCTDYVVLPKSIPTFPPVSENTPFGCRWVRKSAFISLLSGLGSGQNK